MVIFHLLSVTWDIQLIAIRNLEFYQLSKPVSSNISLLGSFFN